jgi:predicted alpha/beta-fold hydrolase
MQLRQPIIYQTSKHLFSCSTHSMTRLLVHAFMSMLILAEVAIPWDEIAANEYAILAYTHRGGHLGWFMWGGRRWFVDAVGDFFDLIEKALQE